jgi:hypothetical protein
VISDEAACYISEQKQMRIEKFHQILGHASVKLNKKTAAWLGLKLIDQLKNCFDCILAKIKCRNINKASQSKSSKPGRCELHQERKCWGENMWLLVEDQATRMKWSFFMCRKNKLMEVVIHFLKGLKVKNPEIGKFLGRTTQGRTSHAKNILEKEGITVIVKFANPNTPKHNGQAERSFATLWGQSKPSFSSHVCHRGRWSSLETESEKNRINVGSDIV